METYAKVLTIAIPFFVGLMIIEAIVDWYKQTKYVKQLDLISSVSSGLSFTLKNLLGLTVVILSYDWMVGHLALFDIKTSWLAVALAFIGLDFAGYWKHRFNHEINLFWNRHVIHHSSEEFNLACALRQNVSVVFQIYFFLYVPLAILGIPTEVIAIVAPIQFFAQFWYHTRLIDKMGFLEYIIVTPSHHRVHHAINEEYIDKNYSEIFIIWDKLFGTFQKELKEVEPVYGIKKAARTWNPIIINFQHLWQLIKDAWHTSNIWDKLRIWFMPTGWRPADVQENFPIDIVEDVYNRPKYNTEHSTGFIAWTWVQFVIVSLLQYYMLISVADLSLMNLFVFVGFLFLAIFSYTSLMDGHWIALAAELLKFGMGILMAYAIADFPYISGAQTAVLIAFVFYLVLSLGITASYVLFGEQGRKYNWGILKKG